MGAILFRHLRLCQYCCISFPTLANLPHAIGRYDLPPTQVARPLPVVAPKQARQAKEQGNKPDKKNGSANTNAAHPAQGVKRKRGAADKDDAPRAFKRLMALKEGKKFRSGLDDGLRKDAGNNKKKKKKGKDVAKTEGSDAATADTSQPNATKEMPTIRPGERMSDFARRVDAALPVMGLVGKTVRHDGKDPLGLKVHRTLKEKKMHKLYDEWRREEAAIQEKRREEAEEAEERELEEDGGLGVKWRLDMENGASKKKKKKGKKGTKSVWEVDDGDDADPWAELKKKRGEAKIGLHDVAKAPPVFKAVPTQVFKVAGATVDVGTIPKAAGSLKRREELQTVREEVIAKYRQMMEGKRAKLDGENA